MTAEQIDLLTDQELEAAIAISKGAMWWMAGLPIVRSLIMPDRRISEGARGRVVPWNGDESIPKTEGWYYLIPRYLDPAEAMKLQVEAVMDVYLTERNEFFHVHAAVQLFTDCILYSDATITSENKMDIICLCICRTYLKQHFAKLRRKPLSSTQKAEV